MTREEETSLHNFEALVRQMMMAHRQLKAENEQLKKALQEQQQKNAEAQTRTANLEKEFEALRSARIIEVSGTDIKETRAKIARLIREVDKCIAMLNV